MSSLPTGTVTFLLTDVEGSTRLWEQHPEAMRGALVQHDAIVEFLTEQHGGQVVRPRGEGDSRFCVFARATDAVAAAASIQRALHAEAWPTPTPVRARMALHTGEADLREGDYYGPAVNRCARLRAIAHGGQTLVSRATRDLVVDALPPGVALLDLGEQRLKDLQRPEPVFQLGHADLPDAFPPLRSLEAVPNNFPVQVTSLVGREAELAAVGEVLGSTRLLTLTGAGGVGKTRLALQAAADRLEAYPDGAWFVDLAPLTDPELVPAAALAALRAPEVPGRGPLGSLVEHLRRRAALLVLDNCEHLIAACAALADALLRGCPGVRLLATSRELLGIAGEVAWRVPSLAAPADRAVAPAELDESPAVRLFVERARAVQPAFALSAANDAAVALVCRRLDGIPLALELAAARVRVLTAAEIAARLDDRFRLLTGGSRTALRRQQTLQATVDWSHDLLAEPERALFRRLSVFAGGWRLAAAEAICAGGPIATQEVLDRLAGLVDKSLVAAEETGDGTRYRLSETVRQYAGQKLLEAGEAAAVRARHRDWYVAWAEQADRRVVGRGQRTWIARLDAEHDNRRAAIEWSAAAGDGAAELRLAAGTGHFWDLRGHVSEGRARLRAALERGPPEPSAARAHALLRLGVLEARDERRETARALCEESVAVARAVGDRRALAIGLKLLGAGLAALGDGAAATAALEALATARAIGEEREVGAVLVELAYRAWQAGDRAAAERMAAEAGAVLRRVGEREALSGSVRLAGTFALLRGRTDRARALYEEALALADEMDFAFAAAMTRLSLGDLERTAGDAAAAAHRYREALRIARDRIGATVVVFALRATAGLWVSLGLPERATRLFGAERALRPDARPVRLAERHEEDLAAARAALGEEAFGAAWAAGQALTLEEAVAEALAEAPGEPAAAPAESGGAPARRPATSEGP